MDTFWGKLGIWVAISFSFTACNLEKEIEIELPGYDEQVIVECYLEPGLPFRLALTKSAGYFDVLPSGGNNLPSYLQRIQVEGAAVHIRYENRIIPLYNSWSSDADQKRFYNYTSKELVPLDTVQPFFLEIYTKEGDTIRAMTRIPSIVPIDSVVVEFKPGDSLARALTYFTDIAGETNYFRRVLQKGNIYALPEQDFSTDDRFVENVFVFGTGYDYKEGDTLINTMFHLEEAHFRFLESVRNAVSGNSNPFSQASPILSNVHSKGGAMGIFTGLRYHRVWNIVKRP